MPRDQQLIKLWNDWSDGVGFLEDDGSTKGLYFARHFVGGKGMLQVTPRPSTVNITAVAGITGAVTPHHYFEEVDGDGLPKLYVISKAISNISRVHKIDTNNGTYGTVRGTRSQGTRTFPTGQPAKYQGNWYVSGSNSATPDQRIEQLTTVGIGAAADTWTASAANAAFAGTHLGLINNQLCKYISGSGVNILAEDATWNTAASWGSFFEVGDLNDQALALLPLRGAMFPYSNTGIYSFNNRGRSGLAVEDMGSFARNLSIRSAVAWKEGMVIAHPTGLYYYVPGNPPINISLGYKNSGGMSPRISTTGSMIDPRYGQYYGLAVIGDNIYTSYHAQEGYTTVPGEFLLLWGRAINSDPTNVAWNIIAAPRMLMNGNTQFNNVYVARLGEPIEVSTATPTLWFGGTEDLTTFYMFNMPLTENGSFYTPRFRTEFLDLPDSDGGTAPVYTQFPKSIAVHSELLFSQGMDLTEVVVYLDDAIDGDLFTLRLYSNDIEPSGSGIETGEPLFDGYSLGAPLAGQGRHSREIDYKGVYRMNLAVEFETSAHTGRITSPPSIRQIELYGRPSE